MSLLTCTKYSEKVIVLRGDTKDYKEELKQLGGKYNTKLQDGAGWIFPKISEDKVTEFISQKKSPKRSTQELLSEIETAMKNMDAEECLDFISNVTRVASHRKISAIVGKVRVADGYSEEDEEVQYK